MKINLEEYLEISSIHGLVYTSKRKHIIERIFWAICLILSAFFCLWLIIELTIKMINFPTVVYLSDVSVPVSDIYFPAVTICPHFLPYIARAPTRKDGSLHYLKFEKHTPLQYVYEYEEYLEQTIDERKFNLTYVEILKRIEERRIDPKVLGLKILKRLQAVDLITNQRTFSKLNLSIPADDILEVLNEFEKEFQREIINFYWGSVEGLISEIITPYGLCLTFNMAMPEDFLNLNSTSDFFHTKLFLSYNFKVVEPEYLPRKIATSILGLYISIYILFLNLEQTGTDRGDLMMIFHDPFELPSSSKSKFLVKSFQASEFKIHPEFYTIDDSLIDYSPADRNCYLDTERTLKFFKKYTKANCIQECLTDFMISRCSCVEFFMIRNSTTRVCSANEKNCTENARDEFETQQQSCGCLQPCNYVKYEFKRSLEGYGTFNSDHFRIDANIAFNNDKFNHLIHKRQFNELDFLSFIGGLFGLFAGFSVLSFVELVYWFTVRLLLRKTLPKVTPVNDNSSQRLIWVVSRSYIVNYFKESSIHGLVHIPGSKFVQRFLWIFSLTASMTACLFMISETREKIPDSRVVAYDDNFKFINDIPFPAFTFIPRFLEEPYVDYEYPLNVTDKILRNEAITAFCALTEETSLNSKTYDMRPYFSDAVKSVSEVYWFQDQFSSFNDKFQPSFAEIRTQRGMGFSFNLIEADELLNVENLNDIFYYHTNLTTKSPQNSSKITKTVFVNNKNQATFKLHLQAKPSTDKLTCIPDAIAVHDTNELPTFLDRNLFMTVQYGMELDIEVTPEIIKTDQTIKSMDPKARECYFDDEKVLKFFKVYSQKNCLTECFANLTLARCKCTPDTQPYKHQIYCPLTNDLKTINCKQSVNPEFISLNMSSSDFCSCLPTCDSVTYHIKYFHKFSTQSDEISINLRVNTEDAILFRRYQQFTFSDVVSYVGGLLGLFAGISMLSIVEIFYFFVIRVVVDIWRAIKVQN